MTQEIRAPAGVRAIGLLTAAVGAAGCVAIVFGGWVLAVPGVVLVWWGLRTYRVAVIADDRAVVVRNRLRTRRVAWSDVVDIGFHERDLSARQWSMSSRRAGLIATRSGRNVWVEATETSTVVLHGSEITAPDHRAEVKLEQLRRTWAARTGAS